MAAEIAGAVTEAAGRRPEDPRAFVRAAEARTNSYSVDGLRAVFARDAVSTTISDGARDERRGVDAIVDALAANARAFRALGLKVTKTLVAAGGDPVVAHWQARFRGRERGEGFESWRFDGEGKVVEHHLNGSLNVRPASHPYQALLLLLSSPTVALTVLKTRLSSRSG